MVYKWGRLPLYLVGPKTIAREVFQLKCIVHMSGNQMHSHSCFNCMSDGWTFLLVFENFWLLDWLFSLVKAVVCNVIHYLFGNLRYLSVGWVDIFVSIWRFLSVRLILFFSWICQLSNVTNYLFGNWRYLYVGWVNILWVFEDFWLLDWFYSLDKFVKSVMWLITCLVIEDICMLDGLTSFVGIQRFLTVRLIIFFSWICQVFNVINYLFGIWRYLSVRLILFSIRECQVCYMTNNLFCIRLYVGYVSFCM